MQRYRFDDKRILIEAIVELLNRGVEPDELDLVLSRIGPVDLDLMRQCLIEVWDYNHPELAEAPMAA
ncbi:hypothetical protein [Brucella intermedia]|uniref:Uncharacterized protein n=1 Tax=Brucella intermedia TaxID=94625 RepID=A0A6N6RBQ0_9HYPH|nr:hypothetical protein [Brucella intermedia]KAB2732207.1 hypothetical protein F9L02_05290 [Brucella intermedia]WGG59775.1 hypothetical protein QA414_02270 [Brucella intermedia]HHV70536.1 hypothetical protein [Brucella intermedia]